MSMSRSAAAESSRGRQKPEPEPAPPLPPWVALSSTPIIIPNGSQLVRIVIPGRDVVLRDALLQPPRPTLLRLYPHVAPDTEYNPARAYILAAHRSGRILFTVIQRNRGGLFLCDAHRSTAPRLPRVPDHGFGLSIRLRPGLSIGLIPDTHLPGHYRVAQLQPRYHNSVLVYYDTVDSEWYVTLLGPSPDHVPFPVHDHGVLAHADMLWWVSLYQGLFFCNPFAHRTSLDYVQFPRVGDHPQLEAVLDLAVPIEQRRSVRLSEGRLRFIDIRGLSPDADPTGDYPPSVWMFTLADPQPRRKRNRSWTWTFEYMAPFYEIWADPSYINAGLPPNRVPHIAFVDPTDCGIVYFFLDLWIFGVDVRQRRVLEDRYLSTHSHDRIRNLRFQSSRPVIDAFELLPPPPTPGDDPSPSSSDNDDASRRWCEFDVEKYRRSTERVTSWLNNTALTIQGDEGQSSSAGEPGATI